MAGEDARAAASRAVSRARPPPPLPALPAAASRPVKLLFFRQSASNPAPALGLRPSALPSGLISKE